MKRSPTLNQPHPPSDRSLMKAGVADPLTATKRTTSLVAHPGPG